MLLERCLAFVTLPPSQPQGLAERCSVNFPVTSQSRCPCGPGCAALPACGYSSVPCGAPGQGDGAPDPQTLPSLGLVQNDGLH